MGFGLTRKIVGEIIMDYLKTINRPHPFKVCPGYDWWKGFMRRWPTLTERKPQHLSRKRAEGADEDTIKGFLQRVETLLHKADILDSTDLDKRLWNCDETGLCNAVTSGRILSKRGSKWVPQTAGGSGRSYTTVHGCGSASGVRLPPFVVYKGKHIYATWTKYGPAGAMYSVSDSGWMEKENYHCWFKKMFLPATSHLRETGAVILFFDGHYSHISIQLIKLSQESNVHLMLLPSNTTHVLQPLDVGVYGPLKQAWKKILAQHKFNTRAANIGKEDFPMLLAQLWEASFKPSHLVGGFRETGLFPLNYSAIPAWKVAPALPLQGSTNTCVLESPLRTQLRQCFIDVIKPKEGGKRQRRQRVDTIHYGEALTNDEVLEKLERQEKEKQEKGKKGKTKAQKKTKKTKTKDMEVIEDEEHCQICGDEFEEGTEDTHLGCDECWRWVHCYCVGFDVPPDAETEWLCHHCK